MPFDPAQPADHSDLSSQVMRAQLTALFDLIQAIAPGVFTGAPMVLPFGWNFLGFEAWNGAANYNAGDALTYNLALYVALAPNSAVTPDSDPAVWTAVPVFFDLAGAATAKADAAQAASSANSNAVATLDTPFADPDTEAVRQNVNELINAQRR